MRPHRQKGLERCSWSRQGWAGWWCHSGTLPLDQRSGKKWRWSRFWQKIIERLTKKMFEMLKKIKKMETSEENNNRVVPMLKIRFWNTELIPWQNELPCYRNHHRSSPSSLRSRWFSLTWGYLGEETVNCVLFKVARNSQKRTAMFSTAATIASRLLNWTSSMTSSSSPLFRFCINHSRRSSSASRAPSYRMGMVFR